MPQPPTIFPKLHVSSRLPESLSAPTAAVALPNFGPTQNPTESSPHQPIFRSKRKHVLKACDRCRVKKTKCDGNQPCYRCAVYNHPCLFRERKATQTKAYSRGFVEMLESHHSLVVKALQQLYTHCINNKCFPGDPIDVVDGYPLTHAILDRLGLIKQAEEDNLSEKIEGNIIDASRYWKNCSTIPASPEGDDSPLEPTYPLERSPSSDSPSVSTPSEPGVIKCEPPAIRLNDPYNVYAREEPLWPLTNENVPANVVDFNHAFASTGFHVDNSCSPTHITGQTNLVSPSNPTHPAVPLRGNPPAVSGNYPQPGCHGMYSNVPNVSYHGFNNTFPVMGQQAPWTTQSWAE